METLYRIPYTVLECPNLKLKKPSWLHMPSAMTVYAAVVVSYFLITGGECPSVLLIHPMGHTATIIPGTSHRSYHVPGHGGRQENQVWALQEQYNTFCHCQALIHIYCIYYRLFYKMNTVYIRHLLLF